MYLLALEFRFLEFCLLLSWVAPYYSLLPQTVWSVTFPSDTSILSAKLFPIQKALEVMANLQPTSDVLILTDSMPAM